MNREMRQEYRLNAEYVVVFVVLPKDDEQVGPHASELLCKVNDLSANGVSLELDRALQQGGIHQVKIEAPKFSQTFTLVAEVKWCRRVDENSYIAGMAFFDAVESDIVAWKEAVAEFLAH